MSFCHYCLQATKQESLSAGACSQENHCGHSLLDSFFFILIMVFNVRCI